MGNTVARLALLGIVVLMLTACDRSVSNPPQVTVVKEDPSPAAADAKDSAIDKLTDLEDVMKWMARSYKYLRSHVADAANDAQSLQHLERMKVLVARAGQLTPPQVSKLPEAEQAAKLTEFHEHLSQLPPLLDALEAAIKADDREAAKVVIQKLRQAQQAGHKAMGVEEH